MLTKGQRDDWCAYMIGGTGFLWLLGGLSAVVAVPTIAASVVGLAMNQPRRTEPSRSEDDIIEQKLLDLGYGVPCVQRYRQRRQEGVEPQVAARDAIYMVLQGR